MEQLANWRRKIVAQKIDGALQLEIADKILGLLEQRAESGSSWQEMLFVQAITQAITGLSINVNSLSQPTEAGLATCLIGLRKAMTPIKEPDYSDAHSDFIRELYSYGKLVATVQYLKKQII